MTVNGGNIPPAADPGHAGRPSRRREARCTRGQRTSVGGRRAPAPAEGALPAVGVTCTPSRGFIPAHARPAYTCAGAGPPAPRGDGSAAASGGRSAPGGTGQARAAGSRSGWSARSCFGGRPAAGASQRAGHEAGRGQANGRKGPPEKFGKKLAAPKTPLRAIPNVIAARVERPRENPPMPRHQQR